MLCAYYTMPFPSVDSLSVYITYTRRHSNAFFIVRSVKTKIYIIEITLEKSYSRANERDNLYRTYRLFTMQYPIYVAY